MAKTKAFVVRAPIFGE